MRRVGFLFSVRFWVATWIVILFIGLTPLPPVAELVIVVGFVAHAVWFLQRRLRAIASRRALARAEKAEEAEFRRRRRWRNSSDHSEQALVNPEPADLHITVCPSIRRWTGWAAAHDAARVATPARRSA